MDFLNNENINHPSFLDAHLPPHSYIESLEFLTIDLNPQFFIPINHDIHHLHENIEDRMEINKYLEKENTTLMNLSNHRNINALHEIHTIPLENMRFSNLKELHAETNIPSIDTPSIENNHKKEKNQDFHFQVDMNNHFSTIKKEADIDSIISSITSQLADAIHTSVEGIYP